MEDLLGVAALEIGSAIEEEGDGKSFIATLGGANKLFQSIEVGLGLRRGVNAEKGGGGEEEEKSAQWREELDNKNNIIKNETHNESKK